MHFSQISLRMHIENFADTHLYFLKELAEATTGVHLETFCKFQDKLHDYGLVGHLLHQGMFLQVENRQQRALPNETHKSLKPKKRTEIV